MKKYLVIVGICSLGFLFGCGREKYNVLVKNVGTEEIDNATVRYNKFGFNFGYIGTNSEKEFMGAGDKHPLPETATVSWDVVKTINDPNKDGKLPLKVVEMETLKKCSKTVKVKDKFPAKLKGKVFDLYFIIDDGDVNVEFKEFP